jgi:hypothetical protein
MLWKAVIQRVKNNLEQKFVSSWDLEIGRAFMFFVIVWLRDGNYAGWNTMLTLSIWFSEMFLHWKR